MRAIAKQVSTLGATFFLSTCAYPICMDDAVLGRPYQLIITFIPLETRIE